MHPVGAVIYFLLWAFWILLFVRLIVDWVQVFARSWAPTGAILVVLEIVYSITDPPIKALRSVLPTPRIGGIGLDLSFLVVMLIVWVLMQITVVVFSGA